MNIDIITQATFSYMKLYNITFKYLIFTAIPQDKSRRVFGFVSFIPISETYMLLQYPWIGTLQRWCLRERDKPYKDCCHGMVRVGRELEDHLVPTSLTWAGTSSTRVYCWTFLRTQKTWNNRMHPVVIVMFLI